MTQLPILKSSDWQAPAIEHFLGTTQVPMRLACQSANGYPLACSVWFYYDDGALWCASHQASHLVKCLRQNPRVGFEIGVNEPPYQGVRGQGDVTLIREKAGPLLTTLIDRYGISKSSSLARWLLGRVDEEYAIKIDLRRISAWDYTERMTNKE